MNKLLYTISIIFMGLCLLACSEKKKEEAQKWEYFTLKCPGYEIDPGYGDFFSSVIPDPYRELDSLGALGWELVDILTKIETRHPNYGNDKYVTGIRENVRTASVTYIFKRPVMEGNQSKTYRVQYVRCSSSADPLEVDSVAVDEPLIEPSDSI